MGIGKTTLASALATRLGWPMRDSDSDIETLTGRTGRDIVSTDSVSVLHELERAVLLGALADPERQVIAAAASVVDSAMVRGALSRTASVIHLEAPLEVVSERQRAGTHRRPVDQEEIARLIARRRGFMTEVESLRLDATATPEELADQVQDWLARGESNQIDEAGRS